MNENQYQNEPVKCWKCCSVKPLELESILSYLKTKTCTTSQRNMEKRLLLWKTSIALIGLCFFSTLHGQENGSKQVLMIEEMVSKIDTVINPYYEYDHHLSKFVPPAGKTLLIMGQTVERIQEYQKNFGNMPQPGGWSTYWGIPEFKGITHKHKNNTGSSQHHQMLIDSFPNSVIHSGLWMVGKWSIAKKAAHGDYNHNIKKFGAWAKRTNRPIYLRIGYEFDGPHNELDPKEYVKAYRKIVKILRKSGAKNIAFVWHSYASKPYNDHTISEWYPGDDYVDWVGISVFGHAYNGTDFGTYCNEVLEFAKQHHKPVMIAEANPIHGIKKEDEKVWSSWFANFFSFAYNKNIKAICFINENWQNLSIPGIDEWQDSRLSNNGKIAKAWFMETNKERYLKATPELFQELNFPATARTEVPD